jgi:Putative restriction endonuclease
MVSVMAQLQGKLLNNTWTKANWENYVAAIESPEHKKHQGYYYNGYMRVEDLFIGADVARSKPLIYFAILLFGMAKEISISGFVNCSYRKIEVRECQPDISFYIGDRANLSPTGKSVVNLDEQAIPNLVIEISNTTIEDDLGTKRLLYEEMGVSEYWVVDVQKSQIYAFTMIDRGSKRIDNSLVLPGLSIDTITTALNLSKEQDQSQIGKWLMGEFQT